MTRTTGGWRTIPLVLVIGGCTKEPPPAETAPKTAPASKADADAPAAPPIVAPDEPEATTRKGGLAELTREVIEQARGHAGDPLRLVPDAAHFVVQLRPPELLAHAELQTLWSKLETSTPDVGRASEVVRACLGRLEAFEQVVLGFDDEDSAVLIARADGIGTEPTWRCLGEQATARGESLDLVATGTPRGEGPQLRETDGDDLGYFVDDDTVVLVSKAWDDPVRARIRNEGPAALDGQLAVVATRVPQEAPLWVLGRLAGKTERELAATPMAGLEDVSFSLRVQDRSLDVRLTADAGDAADATRVREALQRQYDEMKSILPMLGVPASVSTKIAFEATDDLVSLQLVLTEDELRTMREGVSRFYSP